MIKPWNLNQVPVSDKQAFKDCLLDIMNEGRKLTPMEVAKLKEFFKNI